MARNIAGIGVLGGLSLLAACGDPVPPAAQAGVSIHVQEYDRMDPAHSADNCPPARHWVNVPYELGKTPTQQSQKTTATDHGPTAVNNQDGNVVKCTVKPKGSGFDVTLEATGYAEVDDKDGIRKKVNPSVVHMRIPDIGSGDSSAAGTMTIQDFASLTRYESTQCLYSVQGDNRAIDAGKIWGSVNCQYLSDLQSPGANCQIDTGFFVFENCAQ
jgi:hypothetical protein